MQEFDVVIIGGGPIGIACGLEAKKQGISYIIIEKGPIVNSLFNYPVNMQFFPLRKSWKLMKFPSSAKKQNPNATRPWSITEGL